MRTGATLELVLASFNFVTKRIQNHNGTEALAASMNHTTDPNTPTAPANRIEAGVPRHTWYEGRFKKPKNPTPFQS